MKQTTKVLNHRRPGPLVLTVMDGVGYRKESLGNAVAEANKPHLDWLLANCPYTLLRAHGTAVGLPSDEDMGKLRGSGITLSGRGATIPRGRCW